MITVSRPYSQLLAIFFMPATYKASGKDKRRMVWITIVYKNQDGSSYKLYLLLSHPYTPAISFLSHAHVTLELYGKGLQSPNLGDRCLFFSSDFSSG